MSQRIVNIGIIGCGDIGSIHAGLIQGTPTPAPSSQAVRRSLRPRALAKRVIKRGLRALRGRGCGSASAAPTPVAQPGIRVVAAADVDEQRVAALCDRYDIAQRFTDYRELLACEDVEAVLICAPPSLHCEMAVAAAEAGKHVFCEKPMAMNSDDCTRMIDAAEKAGVVMQVGYVLRYSSERGRIRQAVIDGELGRPVFWRETTNMRSGPEPRWVHDAEAGGGPLYENSHALDFLLHTFGAVESVYAMAGWYKPEPTSAADTLAVMIRFKSGDQALFSDSYALPGFGWSDERSRRDFMQFDVAGPLGLAQFPSREHEPVLTVYRYGSGGDEVADTQRWTSEFGADGYRRQLHTFTQAVRSGRRPPTATGEDARRTIWLIEGIQHAVRTGQVCLFCDGRPVIDRELDETTRGEQSSVQLAA